MEAETSRRGVLTGLGISALLAMVALVTFVLPAEYDVDPLGVGELLGVKGMSGYSVQALSTEAAGYSEDSVEFPLAPFESIEYKYHLKTGQALVFSWTAEAEVVYDLHGHSKLTYADAAEEEADSVSFALGRAASQHGTYVAPYDGLHGWFWENRTQQDVVVKLQTQGFYEASTTFGPSGEYTRAFTPQPDAITLRSDR